MKESHKEFLGKVLSRFEKQHSELVHITDSLGRILAKDVRARNTSPNKDIAAVDGYAILSDSLDKSKTLKKVGDSTAGSPFCEELMLGEAVKVYAGSSLPIGADTVLVEKDFNKKGANIVVKSSVMKGQNVCYRGVDFLRNEVVLKEGSVVTARDIGLAAAMRVPWIPVQRRPNIAIFAIGDELEMIGDNAGDSGKISSSSSLAISAFVEACGATAVDLGVAMDSKVSIQRLMNMAKGVDLIITTGGVSLAADDLLKSTLDKSDSIYETQLELSGATPVVFGEKRKTPLLALPGNPITAQICATLFLRPIINKMTNIKQKFYKKSFAVLGRDLDVNDKKMDYIFSKLSETEDKRLKAMPASSYDRMLVSGLAGSDCLITVDKDACKSGDDVAITRFICSVISA